MLSAYLIITALMSLATIIAFADDKMKSKKENKTRTPEAILLSFAAFGGASGGLVGMYAFRHKTSFKEKFQFAIGIWAAFIIQIAIGVFIALVQFGAISFVK